MAPRITIHFVNIPGSRADRLFWVLEELGLEYNVKCHATIKGGIPPSLKQVTKLGKSPALEIDGRVVTETGSIIHDLLQAYPRDGFESSPSSQSYFWSHFSEGTMMLHLQPSRIMGVFDTVIGKRLSPEEAKGAHALNSMFQDKWAIVNVQTQLEAVEEFLEKNTYFSGTDKIGEGDFMMSYPLNMVTYGFPGFGHPEGTFKVGSATRKWLDAMRARPAWKAAAARQDEAQKNLPGQSKM